jgi:ABC-type multidrug transport system ATPase subunit
MPEPALEREPGPALRDIRRATSHEITVSNGYPLRVTNLTVSLPGGEPVLRDLSVPVGRQQLVVVFGPSGAGKTTLLEAIAGLRRAAGGAVLYKGSSLHADRALLRRLAGLVPQDAAATVHPQLTARKALDLGADLRLGRGTTRRDRRQRVGEVLTRLGIARRARTRVGRLSGGEGGRVGMGLALITEPALLLLDEPTANLDPGNVLSVMRLLAGLAHNGIGRIVIVTTHSESCLRLADRLLVLTPGGKMAYFGQPEQSLSYFGKDDWAQVCEAFQEQPERDWAGEFRDSSYYHDYVAAPMATDYKPVRALPSLPPPRPPGRLSQAGTLIRRHLALIATDRAYLAFALGVPAFFAAVLRMIPAPGGLAGAPGTNTAVQPLLLLLAFASALAGSLPVIDEIATERGIYARERAAGLSATAYLCSKLLVLGPVAALQAIVMTTAAVWGRALPRQGVVLASPLLELDVAMGALAVVSCALGLLLSAAIRSDRARFLVLMAVISGQLVLTGGVVTIFDVPGLTQVSWLFPARWGFAATASTVHFSRIMQPTSGIAADPLWAPLRRVWEADMVMLGILGVAIALLTWILLVTLRPGRGRAAR